MHVFCCSSSSSSSESLHLPRRIERGLRTTRLPPHLRSPRPPAARLRSRRRLRGTAACPLPPSAPARLGLRRDAGTTDPRSPSLIFTETTAASETRRQTYGPPERRREAFRGQNPSGIRGTRGAKRDRARTAPSTLPGPADKRPRGGSSGPAANRCDAPRVPPPPRGKLRHGAARPPQNFPPPAAPRRAAPGRTAARTAGSRRGGGVPGPGRAAAGAYLPQAEGALRGMAARRAAGGGRRPGLRSQGARAASRQLRGKAGGAYCLRGAAGRRGGLPPRAPRRLVRPRHSCQAALAHGARLPRLLTSRKRGAPSRRLPRPGGGRDASRPPPPRAHRRRRPRVPGGRSAWASLLRGEPGPGREPRCPSSSAAELLGGGRDVPEVEGAISHGRRPRPSAGSCRGAQARAPRTASLQLSGASVGAQ